MPQIESRPDREFLQALSRAARQFLLHLGWGGGQVLMLLGKALTVSGQALYDYSTRKIAAGTAKPPANPVLTSIPESL
jgi:hypothetical protein